MMGRASVNIIVFFVFHRPGRILNSTFIHYWIALERQ